MRRTTRFVRLWATALVATVASCKSPDTSELREVNQQKPFVDGGESGSYFESMHTILADQIVLLVELKKKHTALFGAAQSGQLAAQVAAFKNEVKTRAASNCSPTVFRNGWPAIVKTARRAIRSAR